MFVKSIVTGAGYSVPAIDDLWLPKATDISLTLIQCCIFLCLTGSELKSVFIINRTSHTYAAVTQISGLTTPVTQLPLILK